MRRRLSIVYSAENRETNIGRRVPPRDSAAHSDARKGTSSLEVAGNGVVAMGREGTKPSPSLEISCVESEKHPSLSWQAKS
jgi:hypothetical protein